MRENTFFDMSDVQPMSLDEIARQGAQEMLRMALTVEVNAYMATVQHHITGDGRKAIVRNGSNRPRSITVGSGTVDVVVPRTRNRCGTGENFISSIIPPYMRRSPNTDLIRMWLASAGLWREPAARALPPEPDPLPQVAEPAVDYEYFDKACL